MTEPRPFKQMKLLQKAGRRTVQLGQTAGLAFPELSVVIPQRGSRKVDSFNIEKDTPWPKQIAYSAVDLLDRLELP